MRLTDPEAVVPTGLLTEDFELRPVVAADAEQDHDAVMESREQLRSWQQTTWPEDDFTVEANRADLVGLEERHREHRAYTYTVLDPDGATCAGCVYVFPTTATFLRRSTTNAVGEARWADVDAVVYFWVRPSRAATGADERFLAALRAWFRQEWGLARTVYVTSEQYGQQVDLLDRTDLTLQFELVEPGKPGRYLVYG